MKIFVTGTRGIPDIQGGIETHCQNLYPHIVSHDTEVTIIRRKAYLNDKNKITKYKGVKLKDIWCPKVKALEAIIHTFLAVLYAYRQRADIIHIHAIGPSLLAPIARLLGIKVVITHHGPDYNRKKWGYIAKIALREGERIAVKFSNTLIVISNHIQSSIEKQYKSFNNQLIYNGVNIPHRSSKTDYLDQLGITPNKYIIAVGRFVPEKGFHDFIDAASKINKNYTIVLVGDADHEDAYSKKLKKEASSSNIILTGFIKGEELNQIYCNTALFVMTSYHEGLPIALLEALSFNLNVVVSDIPANTEVELSEDCYYAVGDVDALSLTINNKLSIKSECNYSDIVHSRYNWVNIALQTKEVYYKLINDTINLKFDNCSKELPL